MKPNQLLKRLVLPAALSLAFSSQAVEVKVTVENLTDTGGVLFTPLWVGFHDGSFDSYDTGSPASPGLERIAEDGDASVLSSEFLAAAANGQDAVILNPEGFAGAPVFEPNSVSTQVFDVDPATQNYFSYATMILPSNDAFVANANPTAHQLFDDNGDFSGPVSFIVFGTQVRDAGTEANTEMDAAFLNQTAGNTGVTTTDNVMVHPGFNGSLGNPDATPVNILGGTTASGDVIDVEAGDFTRGNYQILRVTISENVVPVRVSIKNTADTGGTFLTPFWVAFHDGVFDIYDTGAAASTGLERIAEDGNTDVISEEFAAVGAGFDTVITNPEGFAGAPLFDPGLSSSQIINLDPATARYFSYASMILPSNDAFIANADPKAFEVFDANGNFAGPVSIRIDGGRVRDAGTEANTESDAAFFNQSAPDTGETTNDVVTVHPGYNGSVGNPNGTPQVFLGGTNGAGFTFDETAADFTRDGAQIAEISISRAVDGGFSGTWFNQETGVGMLLDITADPNSDYPRAVIAWYTYDPDGSGNQAWVVGTGQVIGQTIISSDVVITEGAVFGEGFNEDDVQRTLWGQIRIDFTDCNNATLSYNSTVEGFGSGETSIQRLTSGPVDFNGACQL